MTFLVMILLVLAFVAIVVLLLLPHVFSGAALKWIRRVLVTVDLATVVLLVLGRLIVRHAGVPDTVCAIVIDALSMFFIAQLYFAILTALGLVWQRLVDLRGTRVPFDHGRRRMLRHAAAVPVLAAAGGLYGGLVERRSLAEREILIPVKELPAELRGLRIAQISDVHLGWFYTLDDFRALLEKAAQGAPDLLVLTGDIFDDDAVNLEAVKLVESFVPRFPEGVWFIYGNHEHMRNFKAIDKAVEESHIHKLVNASAQLGKTPLYIAGVDYPFAHGDEAFQKLKREQADAAFKNVPQGAVTLFLAHHPEGIDDGAAHGAALTLTGHTHGCQFGLFGKAILPVFKYNRGLVKLGDAYGYVHSGNGSWFPYRFGCPPEIAYFTLRRA